MKKIIIIIILIFSAYFLHADISVNIPFDPDVIGPPYNDSTYIFTSDNFYVVNNGVTDSFTVNLEVQDIPDDWYLGWCHELHGSGSCHFVGFPWKFEFVSGDTLYLHFYLTITSNGTSSFQYTVYAPSITDTVFIGFTYTTGTGVDNNEHLISNNLGQNQPNPFYNNTTISYDLGGTLDENALLSIYNIKGQLINQFELKIPKSTIMWEGLNKNREEVPPGIYLYLLDNGNKKVTKKMIKLR